MKKIITLAGLFFAGCASSLPQPTSADIEFFQKTVPNITMEMIQNGRAVYVAKCSGCHGLYLPESYRADQWSQILTAMGPKAMISKDENEKIHLYLTLYSVKNSSNFQESVPSKVGIELETN